MPSEQRPNERAEPVRVVLGSERVPVAVIAVIVYYRARLGELLTGLGVRLAEHTPAGLRTGVVARN